MKARIQGFSDAWIFSGGKTAAYRQVGNAFPPPVAEVVGNAICAALLGKKTRPRRVQMPLLAMAR
jgi:DNA (cytosine-5)-methyltransferase 1